ncbi:MAG: ATP-dependent helicase [Kiritimatiellae bacterium]|nr:ATP-dependent helicase [Kiritimatiellia bacterium]
MIDLHEVLNPEQYEAATAGGGPLLVLAAAGTGKTQTLVYRVAYLLDQGVPPNAILLLTFTNRAASEMLERARAVAGDQAGWVWGGTFHSICNRFLRRHARRLGFQPDFTIADRDDTRKLIERAMDEVHVGGKDFPKKEVLNSFFSYAANCARPLEDVLDERLAQINVDPSDILRVHEAYSRMKVDLGIMDFDDLLVNGLRLLEENPDVLADYRRQFLHVLVDEYQDTNVIQSRFVDLLAGEGGNLMAVGDDFQCIYTWRGADVNNILGFEKRHPGARVIKIERNYRSTPQILALANACVAASHNQFAKVLKATRPGGDRPWRVSVRDGTEQGRAVMSIIRNEIAAGRAPGDIAILYRAHFQSIELQMELGRAGIPHTVTSGTGVFEQAHVKDMLSLLRLVSNPADRLAFDRLMSLLPGIGPKSADAIWAKLGGACTLATPEGREALLKLLKPAARGAWTGVSDAIADYFEEGGRVRGNVVELVHAFVEGYYGLYLRKKYEDYADRADDVNEVAQQVAESGSLENFLQEVALITNAEAAYEGAQDLRSQTVRLSTIHQAKGLEWPVVILLWAVEGMFPSSRSLGENQDDSEERRLFYVAVTRARNELAIFTPEWRKSYDGGIYPCRPSRFVTEIPPDCLQLRYGFGW